MRVSVSVDLDNALRKLLPRAARIEAALDAGATAAHGMMQIYPPPPAGSRYRRTGNLRQKLRIKKLSKTSRIVENTASYARFVYGMPQARPSRALGVGAGCGGSGEEGSNCGAEGEGEVK